MIAIFNSQEGQSYLLLSIHGAQGQYQPKNSFQLRNVYLYPISNDLDCNNRFPLPQRSPVLHALSLSLSSSPLDSGGPPIFPPRTPCAALECWPQEVTPLPFREGPRLHLECMFPFSRSCNLYRLYHVKTTI